MSPALTSFWHWLSVNRWNVIVPPASLDAPLRVATSLIGLSIVTDCVAVVVSAGLALLTTLDSFASPQLVEAAWLLASPL